MMPQLAVVIATLAVTVGVRAQSSPARFVLTTEMRIDGEAESWNLFWTIAVAGDGRVVVPQVREGRFHVYDNRGKSLGVFGRRGQGPGEFTESVTEFGWHGDTIWLHDFNQRRLTFVSPALEVARTQRWSEFPTNAPPADPRAGPLYMRFSRLYRDGSQLAQLPFGPPDPESGSRTDLRFILVDSTGSIKGQVAKIPPTTGRVVLPQMRGVGVDVPFAARPAMAVSADGERIGFAVPAVPSGSRGSYTVTVVRRTGDTAFARTYDYTPERIPARAKSDALAQIDRRFRRSPTDGPDAGRWPVDELLAKIRPQIPDTYPPLREIRFGEDETIWLQLNDTNPRLRYRMLDARGTVIADVVLPERSMFAAATRTHLWVIELNEDDVPSLVRYRLSR